MSSARYAFRALFERLPDGAKDEIKRRRATLVGLGQLKRNHAMLARRLAQLEQASRPAPTSSLTVPDDRFPATVRSRVCTQAQLGEPWYAEWCAALGEPTRANRKLWEHAYLAHVLGELDQLRPGRRGLGFGVGREALVALLAGQGCEVVATDLPPDSEGARSWAHNHQYAGGLNGLARPALCDPERFRALVTWRPVDMRSIPDDLTGFDFCWSACSLEHLGTLEAGLQFVERSLATLVPGGVAVHTTEYNVSSDEATLSSGPTVLYRRRDLAELVDRLEGAGHEVAALDLEPGQGVLDEFVDLPPYLHMPPYAEEPHLRLLYRTFTTTSMALVVRAGAGSA